jgi:hypothetical protein
MTTIDSFLTNPENIREFSSNQLIPFRDRRILSSLANQLVSGVFLTKNQADLAVKLIRENAKQVERFYQVNTDFPEWSQPFREIEYRKNAFIKDNYIVIDYNTGNVKVTIDNINSSLEGQVLKNGHTQYLIPLTERNVHVTVTAFKKSRFKFSEQLWSLYKQIDNIICNSSNPFKFESISSQPQSKLVTQLSEEISLDNEMLVADRRHRYQYEYEYNRNSTLAEKIASRPSTSVFINRARYGFTDIIQALDDLDRFPVLVVFDRHAVNQSYELIQQMSTVLKDKSVGIYFRFEGKDDISTAANRLIGEAGLNQYLDPTTNVVGVTNSSLPKFMFTAGWYPRTVISFTSLYRYSKVGWFCDAVDLVVYNLLDIERNIMHEIM